MKKSPLSRKTPLRARKTTLAPRCECGHPKAKHGTVAGCSDDATSGEFAPCPCAKYRPKRSLTSGKPMKARKSDPKKRRFAGLRAPEYLAWIRTLPCYLSGAHTCLGDVEAAHVKSRGAGGEDLGNTLPLCRGGHLDQHTRGIVSWAAQYGLTVADLKRIAAQYWTKYCVGKGV